MIDFIKKVFHLFVGFIKKWGVSGIFAVMTLYTPLWLGYLTSDPEMIRFAWQWVIIWAAPFPPAFLVLFLLAAFYKWLF